jgi:hypothetical protein
MAPGSKWKQRQLCNLPCWSEWFASEKRQLDEMDLAEMFGPPVSLTHGTVVFRTVWSYTVKHDGRKKSRMCCDGYVLRHKGLKYAQQCYAACILQTGMKIFFAYLVIKDWVAISGDAINTYAQTSIPKEEEQYGVVDQQIKEWWKDKHGTDIEVGMVRRIQKSLQGHPRAGQWWAEKIEQHLHDLNFKPLCQ